MERKGIVEIKFLINLLPPECAVCVCVFVYVITKSEYQ